MWLCTFLSFGFLFSFFFYLFFLVSLLRPLFLSLFSYPYHGWGISIALNSIILSHLIAGAVLRIIKLATMDKLADDPTSGGTNIRQQAAAAPGEGEVAGVKREGDGPSDEYHHQFYNTGRIGRRNALPDILGTHCTTTTADLSSQLGALSTSGKCHQQQAEGSWVHGSEWYGVITTLHSDCIIGIALDPRKASIR